MNVILFGPPGIGKSTLIREFASRGYKAIDLEWIWPAEERFSLPDTTDGIIFGGADLDPKKHYPNAVKVLLWMPQGDYEERRRHRDAIHPNKASQREHSVHEWMDNDWDYRINVKRKLGATVDMMRQRLSLSKLLRSSRVVVKEDHNAV